VPQLDIYVFLIQVFNLLIFLFIIYLLLSISFFQKIISNLKFKIKKQNYRNIFITIILENKKKILKNSNVIGSEVFLFFFKNLKIIILIIIYSFYFLLPFIYKYLIILYCEGTSEILITGFTEVSKRSKLAKTDDLIKGPLLDDEILNTVEYFKSIEAKDFQKKLETTSPYGKFVFCEGLRMRELLIKDLDLQEIPDDLRNVLVQNLIDLKKISESLNIDLKLSESDFFKISKYLKTSRDLLYNLINFQYNTAPFLLVYNCIFHIQDVLAYPEIKQLCNTEYSKDLLEDRLRRHAREHLMICSKALFTDPNVNMLATDVSYLTTQHEKYLNICKETNKAFLHFQRDVRDTILSPFQDPFAIKNCYFFSQDVEVMDPELPSKLEKKLADTEEITSVCLTADITTTLKNITKNAKDILENQSKFEEKVKQQVFIKNKQENYGFFYPVFKFLYNFFASIFSYEKIDSSNLDLKDFEPEFSALAEFQVPSFKNFQTYEKQSSSSNVNSSAVCLPPELVKLRDDNLSFFDNKKQEITIDVFIRENNLKGNTETENSFISQVFNFIIALFK